MLFQLLDKPNLAYALMLGPSFFLVYFRPKQTLHRVGTVEIFIFMKKETADAILQDVKTTYANIAEEFDASRKDLWEGFDDFLRFVKEGDKILDAGCGNGRLVRLFEGKNIVYIGCDNNLEFIKIAKKNHPDNNFVFGDLMKMSFQDESFDDIFCIAALHHIPGKVYRQQAVQEIHRVLKGGGILILTNWDRYTIDFFLKLMKATVLKLIGASKFDFKDVYIPWRNKAQRYYHCFTLNEMKKLIENNGFEIVDSYRAKQPLGCPASRNTTRGNLVVVAKKR